MYAGTIIREKNVVLCPHNPLLTSSLLKKNEKTRKKEARSLLKKKNMRAINRASSFFLVFSFFKEKIRKAFIWGFLPSRGLAVSIWALIGLQGLAHMNAHVLRPRMEPPDCLSEGLLKRPRAGSMSHMLFSIFSFDPFACKQTRENYETNMGSFPLSFPFL